jgi:outer membrane biogenesis lipoprotein LolB
MEETMKKSLILLAVLFLTASLVAQNEASTKTKEERWQGHIVRINKSESTVDVRGGQKNMDQTEKRIHFDSSTEWTKQGKPAEMSEFKDGSFVIAVGHSDDKGVFHATRIDLRLPR